MALTCADSSWTTIPMLARIETPSLTVFAAANSDAQLAEVIRSGVRPDGRPLLLMPSEEASRLSDPEIGALIAYIRAQPRGGSLGQGMQLGPIGRLLLALGQFQTAPQLVAEFRAKPLPDFGPDTAPGRSLARACTQCHGPDLTGDAGPDLRIAAAYDASSFARLLRTGIALDGKPVRPTGQPGESNTIGLMAEIAPSRFGGLSDADIAALHAYLTTRAAHLTR
ncbi:MAG TPA: cytochrome c [Caulobacteraceae bacterium]|nr:cytochrome c [Caulobacteraceae bacterium]